MGVSTKFVSVDSHLDVILFVSHLLLRLDDMASMDTKSPRLFVRTQLPPAAASQITAECRLCQARRFLLITWCSISRC